MPLPLHDALPFSMLVAIQMFGLISLAAFRLSEGARSHRFFRVLFFLSFILLGGAAMWAAGEGSRAWLTSAVILAMMSIVSILDAPRKRTRRAIESAI